MRRRFLKSILSAGIWAVFTGGAFAKQKFKPITQAISALTKLKHSAFPYEGENPETGDIFFNVFDGARRGHKSPRGGVHWEDDAYDDRRSLFYVPSGFNLRKPAGLVVFFHGNEATLERDVMVRQQVPQQLAESNINAVLAAPQFAFDVRDSSPGNFWQPGYFAKWLAEVDANFAKLHGQGATAADFDKLPVILVAYSGGYFPAAWCLKNGGANHRITGLILMDALYGDVEKFATWIEDHHKTAFTFSAFSKTSTKWNLLLQGALRQEGIGFSEGFPQELGPGTLAFLEVPGDINHVEFMSKAWTSDPLQSIFTRMVQFKH